MSVIDTVRYREKGAKKEKYEIRIALTNYMEQEASKENELIINKLERHCEKIRSLSFLLAALDRDGKYENIFYEVMDACDCETSLLEEHVLEYLSSCPERYMVPTSTSVFNATVESLTEMSLKNEAAQELLDKTVAKICPQFYKRGDTSEQIIERILEYVKKKMQTAQKKSMSVMTMGFYMDELMVACIYYLIVWKSPYKISEDDAKLLVGFILGMKIPYGNFTAAKRTYNAIDWMADILDMAAGELIFDKIFLKYQKKCVESTALWLNDTLEKDETLNFEFTDEMIDSFEKEDYREYVYQVFHELLERLQGIHDVGDEVLACDFGRNPLSVLLNTLAEVKWALRNSNDYYGYEAFNRAFACVTASYGVCFFDGDVEEELEKVNLIRKSKVQNPERFACDLLTAYVLQLIAYEYKYKDSESYAVGVNMEKKTEEFDMASRQKKIISLKEREIETLKEKLKRYDEKSKEEEQSITKCLKPLENENKKIQKENEQLKKELETIRKQLEEKDSLIAAYEKEIGRKERVGSGLTDVEIKELDSMIEAFEGSFDNEKEEIRNNQAEEVKLWEQRILFVGGRYELIRTLKNVMQNAKFVQTETDPVPDLSKIDRVVYFSNFINHSTYNRVFDRAKDLGIPYQFIHTQNYKQVWELLIRAK